MPFAGASKKWAISRGVASPLSIAGQMATTACYRVSPPTYSALPLSLMVAAGDPAALAVKAAGAPISARVCRRPGPGALGSSPEHEPAGKGHGCQLLYG